MKNNIRNIQNLRLISQFFSPPVFHKLVRENDFDVFEKKAVKHLPSSAYNTNLDLIRAWYRLLEKKYRCEYIYKNNVFVDIIKAYGIKDTLTLNEFKIAGSKADLVLLNGSIKIFEIKTELDDLTKLSKQLTDYQKLADKVYIVTDENYAKKLMCQYDNTNIGIVALNSKNKLDIIKEAGNNETLFEFDTIFKTLRKQEYLDLVTENFGSVPNVPNTRIFRACYELLSTLELTRFQKQVLGKLKHRKLASPELLKSSATPKELKHICNTLDFNEAEYQTLYTFLATKAYVPTIHQRQTV